MLSENRLATEPKRNNIKQRSKKKKDI